MVGGAEQVCVTTLKVHFDLSLCPGVSILLFFTRPEKPYRAAVGVGRRARARRALQQGPGRVPPRAAPPALTLPLTFAGAVLSN